MTVYMREVVKQGDFKLMTSTWQALRDQWQRCDPFIHLFIYICLTVLVWRIGVAIVAFPSVKLNFNDYVWMTQFFGMSGLMYLALVFSGFGLIPGLSSALFFGCIASLAAGACLRVTRSPRLFAFVMCCAAISGTTISIIVGPSLEIAAEQVLPTLIEGASVPGWISFVVEYALGIFLCLFMGRKYMTDMSRRMRKQKPA